MVQCFLSIGGAHVVYCSVTNLLSTKFAQDRPEKILSFLYTDLSILDSYRQDRGLSFSRHGLHAWLIIDVYTEAE